MCLGATFIVVKWPIRKMNEMNSNLVLDWPHPLIFFRVQPLPQHTEMLPKCLHVQARVRAHSRIPVAHFSQALVLHRSVPITSACWVYSQLQFERKRRILKESYPLKKVFCKESCMESAAWEGRLLWLKRILSGCCSQLLFHLYIYIYSLRNWRKLFPVDWLGFKLNDDSPSHLSRRAEKQQISFRDWGWPLFVVATGHVSTEVTETFISSLSSLQRGNATLCRNCPHVEGLWVSQSGQFHTLSAAYSDLLPRWTYLTGRSSQVLDNTLRRLSTVFSGI